MELLLNNTQEIDDFKLKCKQKLLEQVELVLGTKLFNKTYVNNDNIIKVVFDIDISYSLFKKDYYCLIPKINNVSIRVYVNNEEVYCDVREYNISLFLKYTIGELIENDILPGITIGDNDSVFISNINADICMWYYDLKINNEYHNLKEFL